MGGRGYFVPRRGWAGEKPVPEGDRGTGDALIANSWSASDDSDQSCGGNSAAGDAHVPGDGRLGGFDSELVTPGLAGQ
jgi:hypothetical protein